MKRPLLFGLILLAFVAGFYKAWQRPSPAPLQPQAFSSPAKGAATLRTRFVSNSPGPHRHAPSLVELKDGRLRAFWFSGSREGASDVEIRSAVFDKGQWHAETTVIDRSRTQIALSRYVKKLGNPVAARGADGNLHLYYVTVSLGGWAGSSVTTMTSSDDGETWGSPRRLVTSPFINISTLVKGTPIRYADGSIGLPVYHEFIAKFGELLRIDGAGQVVDKQRLSHGIAALQPVVLVRDRERALVLMRRGGGGANRVVASSTEDAGRHWAAPVYSTLSNPDAALSAVVLPGGVLLAVVNDIEADRDALTLVASTDGGANWRTIYTLEDQLAARKNPLDGPAYAAAVKALALATDAGLADANAFAASSVAHMCHGDRCNFEFSYPYLILTAKGDLKLVYTWNRSFIKHVEFSGEWLAQRLENHGPAH